VSLDDPEVELIVRTVQSKEIAIASFRAAVVTFFEQHPELQAGSPPVVHSIKSRIKNYEHLREKLRRKDSAGRPITADNVFSVVTDLAGVRVLHLYLQQFEVIHRAIQKQIQDGEWVYDETPKAYTWDPETKAYFDKFGLVTEVRESYYTSVHYLVRPRKDGPVCCAAGRIRLPRLHHVLHGARRCLCLALCHTFYRRCWMGVWKKR